MKRGLDLDTDVPTPISMYEDEVELDSPSKRNRSTPPPTVMGPVHVNAHGKLAPSIIPPKFSSLPGVCRLLPSPAPVEVHLYGSFIQSDLQTLLSSLVDQVIIIFENEYSKVPQYILDMPELQNVSLIVSDGVPTISPQMVSVQDPSGELARECRVLDPIGGGKQAAPCVVFARNRQVQATVMLGGRAAIVEKTIRSWASY